MTSSFLESDLPRLIEIMKHDHSWEKGELVAMILLKSQLKKIMLTLIHEGTEILSMQTNDSITFRVIEGKLKFKIRKESLILNKGELFMLNEKIKYSYESLKETAFLLTLASEKQSN